MRKIYYANLNLSLVNKSSILIWVLSILAAICIILATVQSLAFDISFYDKEFLRLGTNDRLGNNLSSNLTQTLVLYYQDKTKALEAPYLQPEEISHLQDVKKLFMSLAVIIGGIAVVWALLFVILCFRLGFGAILFFSEVYRLTALFMAGFVAFIFIASFFFESSFEVFHKLLFPQGNFSFPESSLLIQIYSSQFFIDFTLAVLFRLFIFCVLLFFAGSFMRSLVLYSLKQSKKSR